MTCHNWQLIVQDLSQNETFTIWLLEYHWEKVPSVSGSRQWRKNEHILVCKYWAKMTLLTFCKSRRHKRTQYSYLFAQHINIIDNYRWPQTSDTGLIPGAGIQMKLFLYEKGGPKFLWQALVIKGTVDSYIYFAISVKNV